MKKPRQTLLFLASVIFITVFITGCEKEGSSDDPDKIEGIFYYYTGEGEGRIRVIDLNANSPFRRSYILGDEVTLATIANDRNHHVLKVYRPSAYSPMHNTQGRMIKSKVADSEWLFVANYPFSGLTGIAEEIWSEVSEYAEGATGFILHRKGEEGGEAVYAIESLKYRGTYFSHNGHPIQGANLLCLESFDSPEKAPGFRLFETSGSAFAEGDPNVPKVFEIGGE